MVRRLASWSLLSALALTGCYNQDAGIDPPLNRIYFPVALQISPGATRLYVVNSDFDLQYNGGVVQAFDLTRMRSLVPQYCNSDAECTGGKTCDLTPNEANGQAPSHWCVDSSGKPCGPFGEKGIPQKSTAPGRCGPVSLTHPQDGGSSLLVSAVGIGAFATDAIYRPRPNGPGGRLFVPVRGDATLHYIETSDDSDANSAEPFELECGQNGNGGKCDAQHRVGDDPEAENTRNLRLPTEPYGVDATPDAEAIVLTHQTQGAASLFVNNEDAWGDGVSSFGTGPTLQFYVGGMPSRPIGVAAVPISAAARELGVSYAPGFLISFRDAGQIDLVRYYSDAASSPARPFIQVAGASSITLNSLNFDSRGIALDSSERQQCEDACPPDAGDPRSACLQSCTGVPLRVYVANRTPSSLLIGEMQRDQNAVSSDDLPRFTDSIPMNFGPSRVLIGKVIGTDGQTHTRVFVVCFDSHVIGAYDPVTKYVEWFNTGHGPHAFAIDVSYVDGDPKKAPLRALGYVGNFTDSYIGVIDLDQRHGSQYGTTIATIGQPSPPRASK